MPDYHKGYFKNVILVLSLNSTNRCRRVQTCLPLVFSPWIVVECLVKVRYSVTLNLFALRVLSAHCWLVVLTSVNVT